MTEKPAPKLAVSASDPGRLWEAFCESLKGAADVLRRPETPKDEQTLAEGYAHLLRMVLIGLENHLDLADPARPQLVPMVGPTVTYEGVTSDARYLHAFIDGSADHRIHGLRGDAPLIEFGVYTGKMGMHDPSHLIESLTEERLELDGDGDGHVEVFLGPTERPRNWIRTDAGARYLMVRQYAPDWAGLSPGQLAIERLGDGPPPRPMDLERVRGALEQTAGFALRTPRIWAEISDYWADFAVNRFVPQVDADARTDIGAPSGHHFSCGYLALGEGESLEVSFRPGAAAFWSLGLASYWYETIGYGDRQSHLNKGTAIVDDDGLVRVRIGPEPPPPEADVPNWVDTAGHRQGTLVFRWSRPRDPMPDIDCRVVASGEAS